MIRDESGRFMLSGIWQTDKILTMENSRTKVLVTGGAGFIGSHLVDRLIQDGHEVIVFDNLSSGRKENLHKQAELLEIDVSDWDLVSETMGKVKPTYVFHLAAIPLVPMSVKDPVSTSRANILGSVNIFKAAADTNVRRVIFASSSSVYGNQKTLPFVETMHAEPQSPYALQKLVGEQFAILFSTLYELPVVSLRYFNVYGPRIDLGSGYSLVIGKFLSQEAEGKPMTIFGDGDQTRDFCYVDDVVEATIQSMKSDKVKGGEVINIGSERSYSINEVSKYIGEEVTYLPARAGDVLHTKADIKMAQELLRWQPKIDLKEGIENTKRWFEEKHDHSN